LLKKIGFLLFLVGWYEATLYKKQKGESITGG
jgi:hypothetical protein